MGRLVGPAGFEPATDGFHQRSRILIILFPSLTPVAIRHLEPLTSPTRIDWACRPTWLDYGPTEIDYITPLINKFYLRLLQHPFKNVFYVDFQLGVFICLPNASQNG